MKPIRFAGFDPKEDEFDDVEPAPLHEQDLIAVRRQPRTYINLARARHLKSLGRSWDEVGQILAHEEGRKVAYRGSSVSNAVNYAEQLPARGASS